MNELIALNAYTLIVFIAIIIGVNITKDLDKKNQNKIIAIVSIILLSINILKLILVEGFIPVEFSTVSYYVVPTIILLRIKKLEIWAVYAGLMAGFFYYLTMMAQGGAIYELYSPLNIYTSLLCHGSLLFISLIKLKTNTYQKQERYILLIGLTLMVSWAITMRDNLVLEERLFIYELIDGIYITNILGYNLFIMGAYYASILTIVNFSTKYVFQLNRNLNNEYVLDIKQRKNPIGYILSNSLNQTINMK